MTSLQKLEEEYYGDDIYKAQELASLLNESNDISVVETFTNLIEDYGYYRVAEVVDEVSSKRLETGFRNVDRVILLLKQDRGVVGLNSTGKDWLKYIDDDKIELVRLVYEEMARDYTMVDVLDMVDTLNHYYREMSGSEANSYEGFTDDPLGDSCMDTIREIIRQDNAWRAGEYAS